jgi:hypothetical protein
MVAMVGIAHPSVPQLLGGEVVAIPRNDHPRVSQMTEPSADRVEVANKIFGWFLVEQGFPQKLPYAPDAAVGIGALAGFTVPITIWNAFNRLPADLKQLSLQQVTVASGERFYFGDLINRLLAEGTAERLAVWNYLAGGVYAHAPNEIPDLGAIFSQVASRIGRDDLWQAAVERAYVPRMTPRAALERYWVPLQDLLIDAKRDLLDWRLDVAYAAGNIISTMCGQQLKGDTSLPPPRITLELAVWAAILASKLHPSVVRGAMLGADQEPTVVPVTRGS